MDQILVDQSRAIKKNSWFKEVGHERIKIRLLENSSRGNDESRVFANRREVIAEDMISDRLINKKHIDDLEKIIK